MAGSGQIRAGGAYVELALKDSPFIKGLRAAEGTLTSWGQGLTKTGAAMSMGAGIMGAPLLAGLHKFMSSGGDLEDMAVRTGVGTNALSELGWAAQMAGAQLGDVETSIKFMQRSLAAANAGEAGAAQKLAALGMSAEDLQGMAPEEQLERFADAIASLGTAEQRTAAAMDVFGRSGTSLLPMFEKGAAGIRSWRELAVALGLSMSPEKAKIAGDLGDAWDRMTRSVGSLASALGSALAGAMTTAANDATSYIAVARDWIRNNGETVVSYAKIVAGIGIVGVAIMALGTVVSSFGAILGALATTIRVVGAGLIALGANPIVLVAVGIAAAAAAVLRLMGAFNGLKAKIASVMPDFAKLQAEFAKTAAAPTRSPEMIESQQAGIARQIDRLAELRSRQRLSNEEQQEAASIAARLKTLYPALASEIDKIGQSALDSAGAMKALNQAMLAERIAGYQQAVRESEDALAHLENRLDFKKSAQKILATDWFALTPGQRRLDRKQLEEEAADPVTEAQVDEARKKLAAQKSIVGELKKLAKETAKAPLTPAPYKASDFELDMQRRMVDAVRQETLVRVRNNEERDLQEVQMRRIAEVADYQEKHGPLTAEDEAAMTAATEAEKAAIRAKYAEERRKNELGLADEIARAEIETTRKGRSRELALLDQEKKQRLREASEQGGDVKQIERLYDLKRKLLEQQGADAIGTFSAASAAMMVGAGGAAGADPLAAAMLNHTQGMHLTLGQIRDILRQSHGRAPAWGR